MCAPLKGGKTLCGDCKKDMAILKEREKQTEGEGPLKREDYIRKSREVKQSRMGDLLKTANAKWKHLSTVKICINHNDIQAVAACCRCKKNICETCIAFENKDDLICKDCWKKIPLSQRLSRQTKGHW